MQNLLTGPFIKINQNDYVAGMATDLKEREVNERSRDDQGSQPPKPKQVFKMK